MVLSLEFVVKTVFKIAQLVNMFEELLKYLIYDMLLI